MAEDRRLPVGIQSFYEIRKGNYTPVFYQFKQPWHSRFVTVGIGEGIDEKHLATLDKLVVVAVAVYANTVLIDRTREDEC